MGVCQFPETPKSYICLPQIPTVAKLHSTQKKMKRSVPPDFNPVYPYDYQPISLMPAFYDNYGFHEGPSGVLSLNIANPLGYTPRKKLCLKLGEGLALDSDGHLRVQIPDMQAQPPLLYQGHRLSLLFDADAGFHLTEDGALSLTKTLVYPTLWTGPAPTANVTFSGEDSPSGILRLCLSRTGGTVIGTLSVQGGLTTPSTGQTLGMNLYFDADGNVLSESNLVRGSWGMKDQDTLVTPIANGQYLMPNLTAYPRLTQTLTSSYIYTQARLDHNNSVVDIKIGLNTDLRPTAAYGLSFTMTFTNSPSTSFATDLVQFAYLGQDSSPSFLRELPLASEAAYFAKLAAASEEMPAPPEAQTQDQAAEEPPAPAEAEAPAPAETEVPAPAESEAEAEAPAEPPRKPPRGDLAALYSRVHSDTRAEDTPTSPELVTTLPDPFVLPLPDGVPTGASIVLEGTLTPSAVFFTLDLVTGPASLALHFNVRLPLEGEKHIVCNSREGSSHWGEEVRPQEFPFEREKPFVLVIVIQSDTYQITVNGKPLVDFPQRLQGITRASLSGDLVFTRLTMYPPGDPRPTTLLPPPTAPLDVIPDAYVLNLPTGLTPRTLLTVTGTPTPLAEFFIVNLVYDLHYDSKNVALHFNVGFTSDSKGHIACNARTNGIWGSEITVSDFPFQRGKPFTLQILTREADFQVLVDKQPLTQFQYRLKELDQIKYVHMFGHVVQTHLEHQVPDAPVFSTAGVSKVYPQIL
ncbi:fiber protein [Mastadenovirus porcusquartum]|uniref:Fiber protein n=1 Tax=Mastadenovirus porcusquartum TaxID=3241439 RepID=A0A7H0S556_9ADEN|nr:fiber protein [Porcine mastadenovirus B]QNQ79265.1 fiber protein [Porcine mastadenovirus B]